MTEQALSGKTVVVLSADTMGHGDDDLGRILMKGFVFALTQSEKLPDTLLLYNSGALLATDGAETLTDLRTLEKAGTQIKICGTCLKHYDISNRLAVGEATNMYAILQEMQQAGRIIRP